MPFKGQKYNCLLHIVPPQTCLSVILDTVPPQTCLSVILDIVPPQTCLSVILDIVPPQTCLERYSRYCQLVGFSRHIFSGNLVNVLFHS
jgi:hypothetical protein